MSCSGSRLCATGSVDAVKVLPARSEKRLVPMLDMLTLTHSVQFVADSSDSGTPVVARILLPEHHRIDV